MSLASYLTRQADYSKGERGKQSDFCRGKKLMLNSACQQNFDYGGVDFYIVLHLFMVQILR